MISRHVKDVDQLLAMSSGDVGRIMLLIAKDVEQGAGFTYQAITTEPFGTGMATERGTSYPSHKKPQVDALLNRAWRQLERDGFIEPSPSMNGDNGWKTLQRPAARSPTEGIGKRYAPRCSSERTDPRLDT